MHAWQMTHIPSRSSQCLVLGAGDGSVQIESFYVDQCLPSNYFDYDMLLSFID